MKAIIQDCKVVGVLDSSFTNKEGKQVDWSTVSLLTHDYDEKSRLPIAKKMIRGKFDKNIRTELKKLYESQEIVSLNVEFNYSHLSENSTKATAVFKVFDIEKDSYFIFLILSFLVSIIVSMSKIICQKMYFLAFLQNVLLNL